MYLAGDHNPSSSRSSAVSSMTSHNRAVSPDRARFQNANGFENKDLGLELANIDLKCLKVLKHGALLRTLSPFRRNFKIHIRTQVLL